MSAILGLGVVTIGLLVATAMWTINTVISGRSTQSNSVALVSSFPNAKRGGQ